MEATQKLCGATVITYEDAAHWLMIEEEAKVTKDVLEWLNRVGINGGR